MEPKSPCKKTAFDTIESARLRIAEIKNAPDVRETQPKRCYLCEKCGKYHLTSISKAKHKKIQKLPMLKHFSFLAKEAKFWTRKKGWDKLKQKIPKFKNNDHA